MMLITMNVGLWIKGEPSNLGPRTIIADLVNTLHPTMLDTCQRVASSGEPTMLIKAVVMHDSIEKLTPAIMFLCHLWGQDCIALTDGDGIGHLIGPNTAPYGGKFNRDFFIAY